VKHFLLNKTEAFKDPKNVRTIPIDKSSYGFKFNRKWFRYRNQKTFSTFLPPKFPEDKPHNILTIGVFEAMSEVWIFQNIGKHPDTRLVCIDPFLATRKLNVDQMRQVHWNALHNLRPWRQKVKLIKGHSQNVLGDAVNKGQLWDIEVGNWDFLIIDGDHTKPAVYEDALNCLSLCKVGGWMLFDDYHNQIFKKNHVKHGIEQFFAEYGDRVKVAWQHRFCLCLEKVS